jgi:hypothetical protein
MHGGKQAGIQTVILRQVDTFLRLSTGILICQRRIDHVL